MAKASIIIPVYNKEKYLKETLVSVDKQTEDDLEVIIVDDASVDHSMDIIHDFASNTTKQVKIIKNDKNQGVAYSRNIGVEEASGEYVSFVDADDIIDKDFMKVGLFKFQKSPSIDSVISQSVAFGVDGCRSEDDTRIHDYYTERIVIPTCDPQCILASSIACTAKIFKKSAIHNLKFIESCFEDYEFFLCTMVENLNLWFTNETKYRYRVIPDGKYQMSLSKKLSFLDNFEIYDRVEDRYPNMDPVIHKAIVEGQISVCLNHLDMLLSGLKMGVMDDIKFKSNYLKYMKIRYSFLRGIPLSDLGYFQEISDDPEELKANLKSIVMKY